MTADKDALLPQQGVWKLIAPDGRTWEADSPLKAVSAEQRERIPADVQLARITAALAKKDDGWIKCSEDTPKTPRPVLCACNGAIGKVRRIGSFIGEWSYAGSDQKLRDVYAWRELPPLPKGE